MRLRMLALWGAAAVAEVAQEVAVDVGAGRGGPGGKGRGCGNPMKKLCAVVAPKILSRFWLSFVASMLPCSACLSQ